MRFYYALIFFIFGFVITSANAQWEGIEISQLKEMIQKSFKERKMNWQLYDSNKAYNIELYYDAGNIMYPSGNSVIVAIKTVFKDDMGISELKRVRKHNLKTSSVGSDKLKYDNFAYTIETVETSCTMKTIKTVDIILDFDKDNNILNLVPSTQNIPFNIRKDSADEKLFEVVCTKKRG